LADLVVFISAFMADNLFPNEKSGTSGCRRQRGYLRLSGEKSSKSGMFPTGKMIPFTAIEGVGTA
jgi:hypothetical protein